MHPSHKIAYMDSVESYGTLSNGVTNESADIFIPYSEDGSVINYIKEQSRNFKIISEQFEIEQNNMTLSEDFRMIHAKQSSGDIVVIKTEDFIRNELNHFFNKTF